MKQLFFFFLLMMLWSSHALSAITAEPVIYEAGDFSMQGYLAYDDNIAGKRPGILVVHEWWGHNEYARERTRMLAGLGYTALAVDMYGEGRVADHPDDAGKFAGEVRKNMAASTERFKAAMHVLKDHPTVDPDHIAAIGYCFGGGIALQMARKGLDLDAVVSFHGSLGTDTPAAPGAIKAKILVCTGADDKMVPPEQVQAFKREMEYAGADFRIISYPGAMHSFTNPGADIYAEKYNIPVGYNAEADRKSWHDMQSFLNDVFTK